MIGLDNRHLSLMLEAGYVYLGMQRFKEAKEVFEGVLVFKPESDIPLVALGGVSFCQGKLDDAIRSYKKALTLNGESLYAKAYLGEALFFKGDKKESIKLLKEVDDAEPKGPVGDFSRALLDAIHKGFTPETLSQAKEIKEYYAKKQQAHT